MLSQEELDKLLEEEGGGPSEDKDQDKEPEAQDGSSQSAESKGPIEQDDIDSLLEQGGDEDGSDEASETTGDDSTDNLDWGDAFAEAAAGGDSAAAKAVAQGAVSGRGASSDTNVSSPSFSEFSRNEGPVSGEQRDNLDFILELPLEISVELGRKKIQIKDLLKLGQGSVVELNKMAGEPAEIYVNQKLMAKGEVVVVNEKLGVKLSEIISQADRVKSLG